MAGPGGIPASGASGATNALTTLTGGSRPGDSTGGSTSRPSGPAATGASLVDRVTTNLAEPSTQSVLDRIQTGRQGGGDKPDVPDGAGSGGGSPSIVPTGDGGDVDVPDGAFGRQGGGSKVDPGDDGWYPGLPGDIFGRQGGGSAVDPDDAGSTGLPVPGGFGPTGGASTFGQAVAAFATDGGEFAPMRYGRQGGGFFGDPTGEDRTPLPVDLLRASGALAAAGRSALDAGESAASSSEDPATELITSTADEAGVEYDPADLEDPKYAEDLEEINRKLESNPDLAEYAQRWVVGRLDEGASLDQVIEELIRWLGGIAGRQGGG